jgi:hypothetical protein
VMILLGFGFGLDGVGSPAEYQPFALRIRKGDRWVALEGD